MARLIARRTLLVLTLTASTTAAQPAQKSSEPVRNAAEPPRETAAAPQVATAPLSRRAPIYTLSRCISLAERNFPKIHEVRARLAHKQEQLSEAHTAPYSDFTVTGGVALTPEIRGTSVYSRDTDAPITNDMSLAWQVGVEGVVPLWTFGKITNLWDAAEAQVKVGEQEVQKEKNELRLAVRRAYYGTLLARDALTLIREAVERIDKYVARMQASIADGEGDEIELLKLQMNREELVARESEARKQEAVALAGLRFLTGLSAGLDVPDQPLRRLAHHLAPLANYLAAARLYRPEINMARAGVLAREAQLRGERARFFPDLGVGLSARWLNAPNVTDQRNAFVRDAGHAESYGVGLVFRYKLDFMPGAARYAQAQAELEAQRATERYALGGVGVEVEQAYRDAEDAGRRLDAYTRAFGYAKRWLIQVQQGIEIGTFEDADVVDPAKEYALKRFAQMSATLDYNMALSRLAQSTGWDTIAADD